MSKFALMQLETYISDLLYRYECVIVPSFGAFLTQHESAKVHELTHAFYPPKKTISFNEQIQKSDGLLVNYVADVEKIPFEAALKKINKRIKTLKSYLNQGETLTFKNIGELALNKEKQIQFEPSYHLNYLTDAFGLSQLVSPIFNREFETEEEVEFVEFDTTTPLVVASEKSETKKPYLRYAAIALIALTIGSAGMIYVDKTETHNQYAQENANKKLNHKIQEATFIIDNPLPAIVLNIDKTGQYHIVGGAFRVKENAEKKVNQLKKLGFNARQIGLNKYGLHQVAYSSFNNRLEAVQALRKVRNNHNKDAWLLVKKL